AFSFDRAAAGLGNWDYQWKYAVMRHGFAVTPSRNLAITTGFGDEATNLRSRPDLIPALEEMPAVLRHPDSVEPDAELDRELFAEQLSRGSFPREVARWVVSSPRLYHGCGRLVRAAASLGRRS